MRLVGRRRRRRGCDLLPTKKESNESIGWEKQGLQNLLLVRIGDGNYDDDWEL